MNAYGYCRYSSDLQNEASIEQQKYEIEKWCNINNYKVIQYYCDEAISGTKDNREQFQNMIKDSVTKKEISAILVWKFDRFARNKYDSAINKKKLKDVGIKVISITQRIDDSPEGRLMESLIEGMDEYYSANLSVNVKRGKNQIARECKHNGGIPALGYDVVNKEYVINEREASSVRLIFDMYVNRLFFK